MEAILDHILNEKMTLEDVYKMFKTVNQMDVAIKDRDVVSGGTKTSEALIKAVNFAIEYYKGV